MLMINGSRRRLMDDYVAFFGSIGVLVDVNLASLAVQMSIGQGYSLYVQKNSRYSFVHEFSKLLLVGSTACIDLEIKRLFSAWMNQRSDPKIKTTLTSVRTTLETMAIKRTSNYEVVEHQARHTVACSRMQHVYLITFCFLIGCNVQSCTRITYLSSPNTITHLLFLSKYCCHVSTD